ncbi:hypothetical protein ID866_6014 [Astraeus odoratus]|nr:hypothetical protein ID866_6014 [Astraeus odoratus]
MLIGHGPILAYSFFQLDNTVRSYDSMATM